VAKETYHAKLHDAAFRMAVLSTAFESFNTLTQKEQSEELTSLLRQHAQQKNIILKQLKKSK